MLVRVYIEFYITILDEPNGVNITIPNNDRLSNVDGKILRSDFVENAQSITPINVTPQWVLF